MFLIKKKLKNREIQRWRGRDRQTDRQAEEGEEREGGRERERERSRERGKERGRERERERNGGRKEGLLTVAILKCKSGLQANAVSFSCSVEYILTRKY